MPSKSVVGVFCLEGYTGETQYNRDKLLQGQGVDTTLSETGQRQAEAVGRYLRDLRFDAVYTSDLQRARQTAEQILRANAGGTRVEPVQEPLLRERGFGVAEGRPKEDLKNMANAAGQSCRDYTPPGGETLDQVRRRFKDFLKVLFQQMMDDHGDASTSGGPPATPNGGSEERGSGTEGGSGPEGGVHVLAVSHGGFIRVAVKHLLEELGCTPPDGARPAQLTAPCPNTGVSRFLFTLRRAAGAVELTAARCVFTNRKEHLEGLKEC
ncbi:unnamed protein product [Boreogadus saida]